ncbi:MAG: DEAD/DEAH box helicase family protein [Clostridia bacterium]|nr:DEAD/DEAH box helicase family protein [Clostridia bacterium]
MKLQFKHQKFQADAAKAVCDVFAGQPYLTPTYMIDQGISDNNASVFDDFLFTGWGNQPIVPELSDQVILENLNKVQRTYGIEPSKKLEGRYNLTVEMETGVGKTYTYIKTMYELNKRYGWSKFIVVVPSVAIREGVYKTFQITQDHFAEEYGKRIRFFIYNSARLTEIDRFASDSSISVMIINSQAFNARGKDARRIYMELDEFRSRRPIDIIAKTNPILIIDEPQSVEGKATKERLKEFNPLMTLRYSATHKKDSVYNMVYRLDAMDAYNKKLVKKIAVKGISVAGSTATEGYVYLESINLSKGNPTATLDFEAKGAKGIRKVVRTVGEGYNLYEKSGELEQYRHGFTETRIDGRDSSLEFANGIKLFAGDVIGTVNEEHLRRIQIRETILSHLERERQLFYKGIKVLSLFFIDEVAKYRLYDDKGQPLNGDYANLFEEEYRQILGNLQHELGDEECMSYLNSIPVEKTHAGYFSIDKKSKRLVDSKLHNRREMTSDDTDAYELIMRNKERLLDLKEPVRFIFSHSALREGWDNPNVFQICTLKQSGSDIRKRQEVGRGLRLAVNQLGERMDVNVLGEDVHHVNVLTVIANESYDSFAKGLQAEIAEAVADRPVKEAIYDSRALQPENARSNNVELRLDRSKLAMKEFKQLWERINTRSAYVVDFDTGELVSKSIAALNRELRVSKIFYKVESGEMAGIKSKEELQVGAAFTKEQGELYKAQVASNANVKYDLIGKLVAETNLTRATVVKILKGIEKKVFDQFKDNPEEFIIKAGNIINEQKATVIIQHITYNKLDAVYDTDIFTEPTLKGQLGVNAMVTRKHLYDYMLYDSNKERDFARELDASKEVAVYVKLPRSFYINTPVGKYNPDWAIAFYEGQVKHIYFVAETKGSLSSMQFREMEKAKIHCAREHFKAISTGNVIYDVVESYEDLMNIVMK